MKWRILLFLLVFIGIIILCNLYVWWRLNTLGMRWFFILIAISIGAFMMGIADRFFANGLAKVLYMAGMIYWGFLFLLFCSLVVTESGRFFAEPKLLTIIALSVAGILTFVALVNGQKLESKDYNIPIEGVSHEVRITHLSDIHLGSIRDEEWLRKIKGVIESQRPDFVVITGDLFDGSRIVKPTTLQPLDELDVPIYMSVGNHEIYDGVQNIEKVLNETGIRLLRNEVVNVSGVQLGAIDHPEQEMRKDNPVAKSLKIDKSKPAILLYHPPNGVEDAAAAGFDLQLSGHTHGGQVMPFNLLVMPFYPRIKGIYEVDGMKLHTSAGSGTWGPPMRLGSRNEVTLLKLVPT